MSETTELDLRMMRRAIELGHAAAERGDIPVGAVIYRDDEILGEGSNRREIDNDPTAHAEIVAMRAAGAVLGRWRLHDCAMGCHP